MPSFCGCLPVFKETTAMPCFTPSLVRRGNWVLKRRGTSSRSVLVNLGWGCDAQICTQGVAWHGMTWRGMVWRGVAWHHVLGGQFGPWATVLRGSASSLLRSQGT